MNQLLLGISLITLSCGILDREGESTKINITFTNGTTALKLQEGTDSFINPTGFAFTPIAVRISKDNQGGYMIWGNAGCGGEKGKKEIDGKSYEFLSEHVCNTSESNNPINLMAGIETVNAELNSQSLPIPPGDYNFIDIIMCGPGEGDGLGGGNPKNSDINNVSFQAGEMTEMVHNRFCSPLSSQMESTVSISEVDTVTIEVSYDVNKMVNHYDSSDNPYNCSDVEGYYEIQNDNGTCDGYYAPQWGFNSITTRLKN